MLARRMHVGVTDDDASGPLAPIRDLLASADVALVNLECVLSARGEMQDKGERNSFYYRGRPDLVRILVEGGIDVVTLGNNHSGDYGPEALDDALAILDAAAVQRVGAGRDAAEASAPAFRTVGDVNVAFVGVDATQATFAVRPGKTGGNHLSERDPEAFVAAVRSQVAVARRRAHVVFLTIHWGPNNADEPAPERVRLARRLIDAGADAVLGHSAHRTQGIEIHRGRPILYDAGNLLWDYDDDGPSHRGIVFRLHFDRAGVRWIEAIPVRLRTNRTERAGAQDAEAALSRLERLSRAMGTEVARRAADGAGGSEPVGYVVIRDGPRPRPPADGSAFPPVPAPRTPPADVLFPTPAAIVPDLPAGAVRFDPPVGLDHGIEMLGYLVETPRIRRHRPLVVTTWWRATRPVETRFQVFLHVEGTRPDQARFAGTGAGDHEPGDWSYPTNRWRPGEIVADRFNVRPFPDVPPGTYALYAGMWHESRGNRLRVLDPARHDGSHRAQLGTFEQTAEP